MQSDHIWPRDAGLRLSAQAGDQDTIFVEAYQSPVGRDAVQAAGAKAAAYFQIAGGTELFIFRLREEISQESFRPQIGLDSLPVSGQEAAQLLADGRVQAADKSQQDAQG